MIEPERVMLLGDTHGNWAWTVRAVLHAAENGANVIVQLGDLGFWVPGPGRDKFLTELQNALESRDITLYWVDGNHECFEDLNPRIPDDKTPWSPTDYPRIIHLPRGYRWTWWGQTWMALGGATSIDRLQRIPGRSWWPEEALTDEDVEYASRPGGVDVLVCHDAPYGANVPGVGLGPPRPCDWPLQTQLESYDHRLKVRKVVDAVRPKLVAHGHMHCRYSGILHLDGHDTMVEGLDCDGTPMSRSTLFINKP